MLRLFTLVAVGLLISSCSKEDPNTQLSTVDLHGSLVIDQEMTTSRQSQGINGEYYKRILTVNGQEMTLANFIKQYCPDTNTRNETCVKAYRIKKIDDVSGATKFLPNGL